MRPGPEQNFNTPIEGDVFGIFSMIRTARTFNREARGMAKLSFAMMRSALRRMYNAHTFSLIGARDKNHIDCVYISCAAKDKDQMNTTSSEGLENLKESSTECSDLSDSSNCRNIGQQRISGVGTVLLCGPNAAMYEILSQVRTEHCWVGFYLRLGFDVCTFNYRGYVRSTGQPTPDGIKQDAMQLLQHLREVKGVKNVLVHGESIGGMIGAHVAAHANPPVKCLIADRYVCQNVFHALQ